MANKLTQRQTRFIDSYVLTGVGASAAVNAGYSPRSAKVTASRMLTKANVREEIDRRRKAIAVELGASKNSLARELLQSVEMAKIQGKPREVIRGWIAICKLCGFFDPQPTMKV